MVRLKLQSIDGVTDDANASGVCMHRVSITLCQVVCVHHGLFRAYALEAQATFHIVAKHHWTVVH